MKDLDFSAYLDTVRSIMSRHYAAFHHLVSKDAGVGFELWCDAGVAWEEGISPSLFVYDWCGDDEKPPEPPPKSGVYAKRDKRSELWEDAYL